MTHLFAQYEPDRPQGETPATLFVRKADASDIPAIVALVVEREGGDPAAHAARLERELAQADRRLLLVAAVNAEVVAYARASYVRHEGEVPANVCPEGWYLGGIIVRPSHRRLGIGRILTARRLAWIAERAQEAYFFVNAQNLASIDLHAELGFEEMTRDFRVPGVTFTGGQGILYRACLRPPVA